jgi:3-hydroxyisobutyrate dehydrogenase
MRIGFIGLGLMGTPLVLNLRKAGFEVVVWNRTPDKAAAAVDAGAILAESIGDLARQSDVVMTMVTDAAASDAVMRSPGRS